MQDPSHGVAQQLQNHVHLISGHRYALSPVLNVDAAYRYLSDAPMVVKQVAPMAWQYVQAPQDGTVWLEWIPPRGGEHRFASDGYVWGDQEMPRREDFGGYTIEILTHTIGYRPQYEQTATHARTRYHFVAKHPNANAPPPDPNLWLVHYHQTDQNRFTVINNLPIHPQMRQQIGERRWLEGQGRIERKDFMLHDREHWPQVTLPGQMPQQHGGHPGMNPMLAQQQMAQARHPSYPWPQGSAQGPPAKRPRHSGPSGAPGSSDGLVDTSIEDEENVSLGDYFDHLSQRDISTARYMQHHRWMEEIFSSPYASSQIVPTDLGLGLMGTLKGLTEGILEPPSVDDINSTAPKAPKAKEANRFTNLKKEQVEEFNSRVQKHMEEGQAEIERMKKEHAEKMAELRKGSVLMQAEKRLRTATWKGRDKLDPAFRLDGIPDDGSPRETVEDIVKEVEESLNVRITGYDDITMVAKGGLEEKKGVSDDFFAGGQQDAKMQGTEQSSTGIANGGVSAVTGGSQHGPSDTAQTQAEALQPKVPQDVPQPNFQGGQQPVQMTAQSLPDDGHPDQAQQSDLDQDDMFGDDGGMDMGDTSMLEGMDMDVDVDNGGIDTSNIDFLDDPSAGMIGQSAVEADVSAPPTVVGTDPTGLPPVTAPTTTGLGEQQIPQSDDTALPLATSASATAQVDPLATTAVTSQPADESAVDDSLFNDPAITGDGGDFNDNTFEGLGNIGDGDDGLGDVDFGMDESAFEGAMHGLEDPDAGDGDVTGQRS